MVYLGFSEDTDIVSFMTRGIKRTQKAGRVSIPHIFWPHNLTKLERFLPKNQHTQSKLLNFAIGVVARCQKLGIILENKGI